MWVSCVRADSTFRTIPTVGILRGGSFFVPARTLIGVKLLMKYFFFKILQCRIQTPVHHTSLQYSSYHYTTAYLVVDGLLIYNPYSLISFFIHFSDYGRRPVIPWQTIGMDSLRGTLSLSQSSFCFGGVRIKTEILVHGHCHSETSHSSFDVVVTNLQIVIFYH